MNFETVGRWLREIVARLGLQRWFSHQYPRPAMVAAVITFDREDLTVASIGLTDEEELITGLRAAMEASNSGHYDSSDWSDSQIRWHFFGSDDRLLEKNLLSALRQQPRCRGASLRVTADALAGNWRETRI
jgi:hypothetical protein